MTPYWTYIVVCWFINIEPVASSTVPPAWEQLIWHTHFLWEACPSLLHLETLRSTSALCLGVAGHLKQRNDPKHKNAKNVTMYCEKDACLQCERWNKRALCNLSQECASWTPKSCHLVRVRDWPCAARIDFVVTDPFQRAGEFANTESANNEDWLDLVPVQL